jgi:uncharacterized protein YcbK (DUF882 family)
LSFFRKLKSPVSLRALPRKITAILTALMMLLSMALPAQAADERRLKFYFTHTKERLDIVYKRNGRYIPTALKKINHFLRDWRQNKSTKMDPRLLDLIWSVYEQMDTREAIHVVSAYRHPKTNNMLRSRSRGVAKNSQHTHGKALDFFIPGVNLAELRATGLRMEVGGVGYYPKSGSPFVHMDTGSVRHWPRMTDAQLAKVFPRGDTTQIPSSGKRQKRYAESAARQKRIAAAEISPPNNRRGGIFARVFNRDQEPAKIPTTGQSLSSSGSTRIAAAPALNVVPRAKPTGTPTELLPATESPLQLALADAPAPRPMPEKLVAMRKLADQQGEMTVAELRNETSTPEASNRSVENAWAQVSDTKPTTDITQIVSADATDEAGQAAAGAPEVASAVLAALSSTREQSGPTPSDTSAVDGPEGTSAAASIAAAILAPDGSNPGRAQNDRFNNGVVTAYAPSAPTPHSRPVFSAAFGFGDEPSEDTAATAATVAASDDVPPLQSPASDTGEEPVQMATLEPIEDQSPDTPIEDRLATAPAIPAIQPRIRPEAPQRAVLAERGNLTNAARSTRRASLSGRVPANATQPTNNGLEFHGGESAVLARMTTPETTRSETFVNLKMPNPFGMQGVFEMPFSVVDNGFSSSSSSLRTDKFSGRAIVATKVAQLTQR